ncbi:hypothetical protein [Kitasatospora sp. McL0602]|uniref:hypothetical protein n=1 Tax=Kitasatospora sp. McL0602 TaxID=3439530 RepID=UPI003F8C095C
MPDIKPGVIPLRPLGVTDIIGAVFSTVSRCTKAVYLPLLAVAGGAVGLLSLVLMGAAVSLRDEYADFQSQAHEYRLTDSEVTDFVTAVTVTALLALLCLAALHTVACATATTVVRHAVVGREVTPGQIWQEARPFLWRVLGAHLLAGLAGVAVLVVSLLPAAVLAAVTGGTAVAGVAALLAVPGLLAAGYVQVRLALLIPVLVLENLSPVGAIRRAWSLNEGAWWRSLGIPYVIGLVGSTAAQLLAFPFALVGLVFLTASVTDGGGQASLVGPVLFVAVTGLGVTLGLALAMPLTPLAHGLLYVDRRIRCEDFGTVLVAEAGLSRWGGPSPAVSDR